LTIKYPEGLIIPFLVSSNVIKLEDLHFLADTTFPILNECDENKIESALGISNKSYFSHN